MNVFSVIASQFFSIFFFLAVSFIITILVTPVFTDFLYRNRIGKKIRTVDHEGNKTPIFSKLHQSKENTPTMGGVLIWGITALITLLTNLSRASYLPLFTIVSCGVIGGIDDLMNVFDSGRKGMRFVTKFAMYTIVATVGAFWFAYKLEWLTRGFFVPGLGDIVLGYWYIPVFVFVLVFTAFAANQTDGLDGLAGGVFSFAFATYTLICLIQGNYAMAVFSATLLGTILAFLWFNVFPARFFMGDTGAMSLGMMLAVMAFLTNTVYILPFVGFIFLLEALSTVVQIFSKRVFKRKVFLIAPIHHHFEAMGWPETKVTMRFWIISAITSAIGLSLFLING